MSDSYYVRSQGKVMGPYSFEDLKAKAGKGHLKKTHQVSKDKKTWQAARRVEGLFPPPPKVPQPAKPEPEQPIRPEPELVEVRLIEDEPLEVAELDDETEWHYCLQGDEQTQGPVSETKLKRLFQSGRLPYDTLVWNETFSDWVEATRIPVLKSASPASPGPFVSTDISIFDVAPESFSPAGNDLLVPPLASASLILGVLSCLGLPAGLLLTLLSSPSVIFIVLGVVIPLGVASILAIVFGHLAFSQIKANRQVYQGAGMAKTGLILGYVVLAIVILGGSLFLIIRLAKN